MMGTLADLNTSIKTLVNKEYAHESIRNTNRNGK